MEIEDATILILGFIIIGLVVFANIWYFSLMWHSIQGTVVGVVKPVILIILYVLFGWWMSGLGLLAGIIFCRAGINW